MLIILEGPDGAGKTTLAEALVAKTGAELWHRGPIQGSPQEEYLDPITGWDSSTHVICDRWHLGELVYGPIFRGESKLDEDTRIDIDLAIRKAGGILVYCRPHVTSMQLNIRRRGDDMVSEDQLLDITAAYDRVMRASLIGGITVNPFEHHIDDLTTHIIVLASQAQLWR
jgi:thymidylate kinase